MSVMCNECSKSQKVMKRCTRCNLVFYCSRECQIKDWPSHKQACAQSFIGNIKKQDTNSIKSFEKADRFGQQGAQVKSASSRQIIDFEKALNVLQECPARKHSNVETDKLQIKSYLHCNQLCCDVPELHTSEPTVSVTIKSSKTKHKLSIQPTWSTSETLNYISHRLQIPLEKLKLICKGRLVTENNLSDFLTDRAVFQAIGEKAEDEVGVNSTDVEVLMQQLRVDRNDAVKALKEKQGDIIDAMLYLGNKT